MPARRTEPGGGAAGARLSAEEFAARFQADARVLWTVAAGVLGDPSEAEDVLQEAALMALGKLEQFERETNFTAWMARFVRFVALNHARKRSRRATHAVDPTGLEGVRAADPAPEVLGVGPAGELHGDQGVFGDRMLSGLAALGAVPRSALLLRTVLGLGYREIASVLEVPEGTAMSHVHRARARLRSLLGEGDHALEAEAGS